MKLIIFLVLLILKLINAKDISSTSDSNNGKSNLIYSVVSNLIPDQGGQWLYVIDGIQNQIIVNVSISVPLEINAFLSVDEQTMTGLLLCGYNTLISVNLKTGVYKVLNQIYGGKPINNQIQQYSYSNNNVYIAGVFETSPKLVSLLSVDFNQNISTKTNFNTKNYSYLNGYPVSGFDYINQIMYITYAEKISTQNYQTNILKFQVDNIKNSQQIYQNVATIQNAYVKTSFIDSQGNVYVVYGNPSTVSFEICQVNFVSLNCTVAANFPITDTYQPAYMEWFLTGDNENLVFASPIENGYNVLINTYEIDNIKANQNPIQTFNISNYWSTFNDNYFIYFYLP